MSKMKEKEEAFEKPIDVNGEMAYEHHKQVVDDNQVTMRIDKFIANQIANMTTSTVPATLGRFPRLEAIDSSLIGEDK